jgi:hypothetical protein
MYWWQGMAPTTWGPPGEILGGFSFGTESPDSGMDALSAADIRTEKLLSAPRELRIS